MKYIRRLPEPDDLKNAFSIDAKLTARRLDVLREIKAILNGADNRKILILGPCSADREEAVLEYACRLAKLQEAVKDRFLFIMRTYTGKPRTTGIGYKGMLHATNPGNQQENILDGIRAVRELHQRIISTAGVFSADELLYPELYPYIDDLIVYLAIGARSVEDQGHRMMASGTEIPVGMKNPTGGNLKVMVDSVFAAQHSQRFLFSGWEVETEGNEYAHAVLRGFTDLSGEAAPNYHYESLVKAYDLCYRASLKNPSVIVDCNHANSGKRYEEQVRIAEEVLISCKKNKTLNGFVKGIMIESYLEDGAQPVDEHVYGRSVTDPCLGWEKTVELIHTLAEYDLC